ncbi:MAG: metallophosphoesterase [Candidatus Lokiarchaeota archaeon]|nr:metallophosphoesterase [Candidatus Lokiarchaeota archaeon]
MPRLVVNRGVDSIQIAPGSPELRVLQVTDLHLASFGLIDRFCLRAVRDLATKWGAHLVACTGDLFGLRTVDAMERSARLFDGIVGKVAPWTFSWGNHDQELRRPGPDPAGQLDAVEAYLARLPGCLYVQGRRYMEAYRGPPVTDDPWERDAAAPEHWDGFHGGNYLVEVMNEKGTKVAWNVFILNSRRAYHLPTKVLNWMADRAGSDRRVPCICFYHVPNHEYHVIWERGLARGIKREGVCFERDRGRVHQALKAMGNIKACFVGHDHVNDYHGVLDGIDYVYGRKTCLGGYGSYKKVPKQLEAGGKAIRVGGKLITLSLGGDDPSANRFSHVTVFADGTTWQP